MKLESKREIVSSDKETLEIKIEWNPNNEQEEGLVALVATLSDLVKQFHRLNTEAG